MGKFGVPDGHVPPPTQKAKNPESRYLFNPPTSPPPHLLTIPQIDTKTEENHPSMCPLVRTNGHQHQHQPQYECNTIRFYAIDERRYQ